MATTRPCESSPVIRAVTTRPLQSLTGAHFEARPQGSSSSGASMPQSLIFLRPMTIVSPSMTQACPVITWPFALTRSSSARRPAGVGLSRRVRARGGGGFGLLRCGEGSLVSTRFDRARRRLSRVPAETKLQTKAEARANPRKTSMALERYVETGRKCGNPITIFGRSPLRSGR